MNKLIIIIMQMIVVAISNKLKNAVLYFPKNVSRLFFNTGLFVGLFLTSN